jgi:hypothetical protein
MTPTEGKRLTLPKHSICVTMEGSDAEGGCVRADDLVKTVERVIRMLSRLDHQALTERGGASFYLRIVDLSYASPARIVMEQVLVDPRMDRREEVTRSFFAVMEAVRAEEKLPPMDYTLLNALADLSAPVGRTMRSLSISANGTRQSVDPEFRARLAEKLRPEETSYGFIRGMLEYINIHGKKHVFKIYPGVSPKQLTCRFEPALLVEARQGIGRFVEVRGILHYKAVAQYPYAIDVQEMEVMPGAGAPDWIGARGMFPDLTGNMSTEEYIAAVRASDD